MARGNDGNLLQHGVEAAIAAYLATEAGLYLVCTHGMRPFEPWDDPKRHRRLLRWIERSNSPVQADEPKVVMAFRKLRASAERYPNTGEVLAALLGRDQLNGFICEVVPEKHHDLMQAWSGGEIKPLLGSWRQQLPTIRSMMPDRPWLFTMDPMSIYPDVEIESDNNRLYPRDIQVRLLPIWRELLGSNQPGAIVIFCFEIQRGPGPNRYQLFLDETTKLARDLEVQVEHFEVSYGNPHVGAVLTKDDRLLSHLRAAWQVLHDVR